MTNTTRVGMIGDWAFYEITGLTEDGRTLYGYCPLKAEPQRPTEWFNSLDRALISAVGEKYTGPRGAGGTGVGTAADWFARMIGMDQLVAVDYQSGQKAIQQILHSTRNEDGPLYRRAKAVTDEMEARGLTLAAQVHP